MAQYIFDGQVNYGWGLTLDMTGKAPEVSKRIFDTYDNMLYYVNDYNDSCIPGLTLTVMNDGDKNGVYFVSKIGTEGANKAFNNDGVVVKQGTNSSVSDVNTALSNEIAARKAVDGQSGQTYTANSTASIISNAISLNDADIKLNNAITAETRARESLNEKIITAVGLNTDGTFKKPTAVQTSGYTTAATSVLDAIIILDNQVEENETVTAYALTDLNNRLLYYEGHNSISSLVSVPTTKRLCIATISSSQTLALNGTISDGRELHIIINNTNTSDVTITIPNTILNLVGENLTIGGNSYGEINLTSDGTNIYYRGIGA